MNDEGFREIQLNGKQLVFLFMATTVVLVVTFLFGVLVGRDVRADRAAEAAAADVAPDAGTAAAAAPAGMEATAPVPADAPAAPEELTYADRLLRDAPPVETLEPARADVPPAAPVVQEPVAAEPPPVPTPEAAPAPARAADVDVPPSELASATDPSGPGFAVQIAAYRDRREAENLARRLVAKGYPAFVMDPVKGAPTALFRVRVGKYRTLEDAEAVSTRLQTAEQFNTAWIAR